MTDTKITFNPPHFPDNTWPKGFLSDDPRSQACWHYYTMVEKQREKVGDSIDDQFGILEGNLWQSKHYVQTAKSVAMIHGLDSPSEFAKAWKEVKLEAARLGLPEPKGEYMNISPRIIH